MASVFTKKRVRIPNRLRTSINPGSNDEGDGDTDCNVPNKNALGSCESRLLGAHGAWR